MYFMYLKRNFYCESYVSFCSVLALFRVVAATPFCVFETFLILHKNAATQKGAEQQRKKTLINNEKGVVE